MTVLAVAAFGLPCPASAAGYRLFQSTAVLAYPAAEPPPEQFGLGDSCAASLSPGRAADGGFELGLRFPAVPTMNLAEAVQAHGPSSSLALAPREPRRLLIGAAFVGAVAGSAWNSFGDGPSRSFHFTNEGFFDPSTYAGGGDKASHIVDYNAVARLMTGLYEVLDMPTDQARGWGAGTSFLAGLATEIGDGTTRYGFSYEDLLMDTVGAGSAYLIAHYGAEDLIGFRSGPLPAPRTPDRYAAAFPGIGKDYTREIATADLKLVGLARRLNRRFGPARFLLLSTTYGVKGYPYALPELRERQLGIELGLNIAEIARAVGVPEDRWWGKMFLILLEIVRFPYTAIGWRYDFNHRRWIGPDAGGTFAFPSP
jgi:hypothetical protein